MKDNRVSCFFKPSKQMPMYMADAVYDIITGLGIDTVMSNKASDTPFIVVRQDMDVATRMLIENSIRPFLQDEPFFIVIEQENGTTYIQQI